MYHIQDVREAQQMWDHKFKNAGREGIVLNYRKNRGLIKLLGQILRGITVQPPDNGSSFKMNVEKSSATS